MLTIAKCKEAMSGSEDGTFTIKEIAGQMNAAYGTPEHAAAKILYSMERKGIITDNDDNERFRLNDEFAQDGGTELIDTLDRAGNNDIKEIAQMLSEEEKALWNRINGDK